MQAKRIALPLLMTGAIAATAQEQQKPNIIILNIDDMGYSDPSCFGGTYTPTPNIDRLAEEGLKFTQFYTSCPISSPSRTGLTTGMYPTRWGITTFLQDRAGNAANEQNDYLSNRAPSMARAMKAGGYTTGHFGKWHMGGGRDVVNPPSITSFGFDEYSSTWESPDPDPKLTSSNWIWAQTDEVKRWDRTAYFVDKTLDFLKRHKGEPCFVNLWPDDVHTPWVFENDEASRRESAESFTIVLKELDRQVGRLMEGLKEIGIDDNTIVIFTSDNGPAPAFDGHRTNSFRGQKGTLYEGGIRMPFIIRWPSVIEAGQVNNTSVLCTVDLFPTLCHIAGAPLPTDYAFDGLDMTGTLLGQEQAERTKPLFWEFGKTKKDRVSPHIAVRQGNWKLLVNADGSNTELYDMTSDIFEKNNVASSYASVTAELKEKAIEWFNEAYRQYADNVVRVANDGDPEADGSTWEKATTLTHAVELAANEAATQVWLKQGIYLVDAPVNIDKVGLYGGFDGTETKLTERDWNANQTIIDGGDKVSPLRDANLDGGGNTVLDGIIVQNGVNQAGANGNGNGGGAIVSAGAKVRNCIFRNNRTQNGKNGAAIHCHAGNVQIENSLFVNNTSSGNGGGVQVGGGVTATITNCTFSNNVAKGPGGAFGLGAGDSNLNLNNTIAYGNEGNGKAQSYGQNADVNGGGKVVSRYSAVESSSKKFTDGDDTGHMALTAENAPGFTNPAEVKGRQTDASALDVYSYTLTEKSPCIDAGNVGITSSLQYDLAHNRRLSGRQIDLGAYEFDNGAPVEGNAVIHVAADGDAKADGLSWATATTLNHALELADTYIQQPIVWLKEGTYKPAAAINTDKMAIYGGFDGTETALNERNWAEHQTIIDGDNARSVLRSASLDGSHPAVIDGIIVQNCVNHANANGNGNGGAAIVPAGSTVRNCIFRNNRTQNGKNGAAIHCQTGNIRIENSLFVNNASTGNGGAVQIGGGATATVINCTFANNTAKGPGGALGLGNETSSLNLYNSIAYGNTGASAYSSYGQNNDVNGGGKVVAICSAIESVSKKFTDGDDEGIMLLSRVSTPGFVNPATTIGKTDMEEIEAASYRLADNSPCIDAGDDNYAAVAVRDLDMNDRIQGAHVDMGAYERELPSGITAAGFNEGTTGAIYRDGAIHVYGAAAGNVAIYSTDGQLLAKKSVKGGNISIDWNQKGVVFVESGANTFKVLVY